MTCNPITILNYNLIDESLKVTNDDILAFTSNPLSRVDAIAINTATVLLNKIGKQRISESRPVLAERMRTIPLTRVDVAEFVYNSFYTEFEIIDILNNYFNNDPITISAPVNTLLDNLEYFLDDNYGAAAASGFCSSLAKPFGNLLSSVVKLQGMLSIVNQILSFDLNALLSSINLKIIAMKEMLLGMVDKLMQAAIAKFTNIIKQTERFVGDLFKKAQQFVSGFKTFFSDATKNLLKGNIENIINTMMAQFPSPLTTEAIMLILMRMCQMVESVQSLFNDPLKTISDYLRSIENVSLNQTNISNSRIAQLNAAGLPVLTYAERLKLVQQRTTNQNYGVTSSRAATPCASPTSPGSDGTDRATQAMSYFTSQGWTQAQAAGIVGNLMAESNLQTDAFNSAGGNLGARGVAQWRGVRQTNFQNVIGTPLANASFEQQLEYVNWELNNTHKSAGNKLRSATTAADAAKIVQWDYEVYRQSSDTPRRVSAANSVSGLACSDPSTNGGANSFENYVPRISLTEEERSWITNLNTLNCNSGSDLYFNENVTTMGKQAKALYVVGDSYWNAAQNASDPAIGLDAGLEQSRINIHDPLIHIRRVAQTLGIKITVNSAYRSPYYQYAKLLGKNLANVSSKISSPENTQHAVGHALDVSHSGMTDYVKAQFVELLSREGFTRITHYDTFFHVDFMATGGSGGWTNSFGGPLCADALRKHANGEFKVNRGTAAPAT